jgi:hypothetical protein
MLQADKNAIVVEAIEWQQSAGKHKFYLRE